MNRRSILDEAPVSSAYCSAQRTLGRLKRLPTRTKAISAAAAILGAGVFSVDVVSRTYDLSIFNSEKENPAPIVRGGQQRIAPVGAAVALFGGLGQTPNGGGVLGLFGPTIPWPIIPIHVSLLPDGRVLSYGTDQNGNQGAFVYDIWDPKRGVGLDAHTTLANTTATDFFCSTGTLFPVGLNGTNTGFTGKALLLGGDLTVNNVRNFSNNDLVVFNPGDSSDPNTSSLTSFGKMQFARWYASTTTLPNGDKLLLGGQLQPGVGVTTPEIFSPTAGWRTLSGISIADAQYNGEWYYPRADVGSDGLIYLLQHNGKILRLNTSSSATLTDTGVRLASGAAYYPTVAMPVKPNYPAFRVMTVRSNKTVQIVDLSTSPPTVINVPSLRYDRQWGTLTLLANGNVLASGGSGVNNQVANVAYQAEIFFPIQTIWTWAATAAVPRLYHSTSLLLPDGSVLTAGGGAPGPLKNLNGEIFYPPYLYNIDGTVAQRPTIVSAPSSLKLGQTFQLTVGANDKVQSVTLARAGFQTHAYDPEARVVYLDFSQNGTTVTGFVKTDPKILLPGYYMLFVFDSQGHPSIAKMVSIQQAIQ